MASVQREYGVLKVPDGRLVIRSITKLGDRELSELSKLLIAVVDQGASVGFLPPLSRAEAVGYWRELLGPGIVLLVAEQEGRIVGTAQLHLALKANGSHRAEVAKVLVDPLCQRQGIGRALMTALEECAREEGRSLLVLDTRAGDVSNDLYRALGYVEAGRIPDYARSANGLLDATVYYYKKLR
jgi:ribosomal protein S18 acetylase RimI-like enzyme